MICPVCNPPNPKMRGKGGVLRYSLCRAHGVTSGRRGTKNRLTGPEVDMVLDRAVRDEWQGQTARKKGLHYAGAQFQGQALAYRDVAGDFGPRKNPMSDNFLDINVGDRIRYLEYAGMGMKGPEYKPASGRVVMRGPAGWVVHKAGSSGARPAVVSQKNFLNVSWSGKKKSYPGWMGPSVRGGRRNPLGVDVSWRKSPAGDIGWCNLCQSPVYSESDPCARGLHGPSHRHDCEVLGCWPTKMGPLVRGGRRNPLTSRRELELGGVERHGKYVTITREHGSFLVKRHPDAGHVIEGARTLTEARAVARRLAAGKNPLTRAEVDAAQRAALKVEKNAKRLLREGKTMSAAHYGGVAEGIRSAAHRFFAPGAVSHRRSRQLLSGGVRAGTGIERAAERQARFAGAPNPLLLSINPLTKGEVAEARRIAIHAERDARKGLGSKRVGSLAYTAMEAGFAQGIRAAAHRFSSGAGGARAMRAARKVSMPIYRKARAELMGLAGVKESQFFEGNPPGLPAALTSNPEFKKAVAAYTKFHGVAPTSVRKVMLPVGGKNITGSTVLWSMGLAPDRSYTVPASSGKSRLSRKWVHEYKTPPEIVATADGRITMDLPRSAGTRIQQKRGQTLSWMEG